jgi:hypothetical protein
MRTGLSRHANASPSVGIKFAGKGFARARDGRRFGPRDSSFATAETGTAAPACANVAENRGFFRRSQETGFARDWVVAEAVPFGPVSARIFPANREKNREFGENRPHRSIQMSFVCVASIACERIPYGMKQGIFSAEQRIISIEQGSGANEQRTVRKRPFLTQLFCS